MRTFLPDILNCVTEPVPESVWEPKLRQTLNSRLYDAIKNRQERPDLEATMQTSLKALSFEQVLKLRDNGAQLVDVREAADFEGAYLAGAINIGLQGKYATWCGSILSHDKPIIVIGDSENEKEAIMRLGRIGFDNAGGYLVGGIKAWIAKKLPTQPENTMTCWNGCGL